jgi:hypothetical protein
LIIFNETKIVLKARMTLFDEHAYSDTIVGQNPPSPVVKN